MWSFLKKRYVYVTVTRDSVCMADDCTGHDDKKLKVSENMKLSRFLKSALDDNFFASISGGKASWLIQIENDTAVKNLAVRAQQWSTIRLLIADERMNNYDNEIIRAKYCGQIDPEKLYIEHKLIRS